MVQGQVDVVWVGVDCIVVNGDVVNKIGIYFLVVLVYYYQILFYVVVLQIIFDCYCLNGVVIFIEQCVVVEVIGVVGSFGVVQWVLMGVVVYNLVFDVMFVGLISGWVLDSGVVILVQVVVGVFVLDNG